MLGIGLFMERYDMAVSTGSTDTCTTYLELFRATTEERIERVRRGLEPSLVARLARDLRIPDQNLALYLGLSRALLRRRVADDERLTAQESEGLLALASLAGSVVTACELPSVDGSILAEPLEWLGRWMRTPMPGLEGRAPIQFMDVCEGRALVAEHLATALSPACLP
jgi:putative toxin-antitoxin system antitoxin component (TIGR02293 family)